MRTSQINKIGSRHTIFKKNKLVLSNELSNVRRYEINTLTYLNNSNLLEFTFVGIRAREMEVKLPAEKGGGGGKYSLN